MMTEAKVRAFATAAAWEKWLAAHVELEEGIWLKIAKKASGIKSVDYAQALEVALCYGWIDGQMKRLDESFYVQKFTPRRAKSMWSQINRQKVADLIEAGRMQPSGQAEIDRAKADGRWDAAYAPASTAAVPADFQAAIDANPAAAAFFETLNKSGKYSFLFRLHHTKKVETRAKKIEQFVEMLARGEVIGG